MSKRIYEKPSMKVIELNHHTQLLQTSADPYDGPFSYTPGILPPDEMNRLA